MSVIDAYSAVERARVNSSLPTENYWLYVKKDGTGFLAFAEEHKNPDYIGFFVEDDSRIPGILKVAESKIKKFKPYVYKRRT